MGGRMIVKQHDIVQHINNFRFLYIFRIDSRLHYYYGNGDMLIDSNVMTGTSGYVSKDDIKRLKNVSRGEINDVNNSNPCRQIFLNGSAIAGDARHVTTLSWGLGVE